MGNRMRMSVKARGLRRPFGPFAVRVFLMIPPLAGSTRHREPSRPIPPTSAAPLPERRLPPAAIRALAPGEADARPHAPARAEGGKTDPASPPRSLVVIVVAPWIRRACREGYRSGPGSPRPVATAIPPTPSVCLARSDPMLHATGETISASSVHAPVRVMRLTGPLHASAIVPLWRTGICPTPCVQPPSARIVNGPAPALDRASSLAGPEP